jgi:hypothetical protein
MWGKYPPRCGPALMFSNFGHFPPVLRYPLQGSRLDKIDARPYIVVAAPTKSS